MEIDWSTFTGEPNDITCRCGVHFESHAKGRWEGEGLDSKYVIHVQTPCPKCGATKDNFSSVKSKPEKW